MKYGSFNRTILSILIVLTNLLFILCILSFVNLNIGNPSYNLDNFGFTRYSYNSFANVCHFIQCENNKWMLVTRLTINLILISIFWMQYLLLKSRELVRSINSQIYEEFHHYTIILPKLFIFLSYLMINQMYQPIADETFKLDKINFFSYPIYLICIYTFIKTANFHLMQNDVLFWKLLFNLNRNNDIIVNEEKVINDDKLYSYCRSPLRSCLILFILFSSFEWNIGKLIFTLFNLGGLYADSVAEETYFCNIGPYEEYKKRVKNRFVPVLRINSVKKEN